YIEQGNWKGLFHPDLPWYDPANLQAVSTQIKLFYCPSNRTQGSIDLQPLVPLAGRPLPNPGGCDYLFCKGTNAPVCGITQVPAMARGAFDVNSRVRIIDIRDGTSTTFAMGEGAGGNPRFLVRKQYPDTTPAIDPTTGQPRVADQSWAAGAIYTRFLHTTGVARPCVLGVTAMRGGFTPVLDEPMNNPLVLAAIDYNHGCENSGSVVTTYDTISGFRSVHNGGCNFLFCDGSARFIQQGISAAAYRALSTIAGGEVVSGDF